MLKVIKTVLIMLAILVVASWGFFALYFGDSHASKLQSILAVGFGLIGILTLFALGVPRWRWRMLVLFGILFFCTFIWWLGIQPANERH